MTKEDDHDILIRIDENLKNLIDNFNAHTKDDDLKFKDIGDRVGFLEDRYWVSVGAIIVIQIVIGWVIKTL